MFTIAGSKIEKSEHLNVVACQRSSCLGKRKKSIETEEKKNASARLLQELDHLLYDHHLEASPHQVDCSLRLSTPPGECCQTLAYVLMSGKLLGNLERTLRRKLIPEDCINLYDKPSCVSTGDGIVSSFSALCRSLPPKSICISGGSVVQAILGIDWCLSDVDIFCTKECAPRVREFLVNQLNLTLAGVKSGYASSILFSDDVIDHVEKYGNTPRDGSKVYHETRPYGFCFSRECATRKKVLLFTNSKGQQGSIRLDGDTRIPVEERLLDGVDALGKSFVGVDLVVIDSGADVVNAIQHSFDLNICKSVFDGNFCIPNWVDTLQKRSGVAAQFKNELSILYMKHLYKESNRPFRFVVIDSMLWRCNNYQSCGEFLKEEFGLEEEDWEWLEADFNSKNVFSGYFDFTKIEARLTGTVSFRTIQNLGEVIEMLRKTVIHTSLYRVVGDVSYSQIKQRTASLVDIVDSIVDSTNINTPLAVALRFAVERLYPFVGREMADGSSMAQMFEIVFIHYEKNIEYERMWIGATDVLKVYYLRKMLLYIVKTVDPGVSDDTQYARRDSVLAKQFHANLCSMLPYDISIYDNELGPFFFHHVLTRSVKRWRKYMERGVDLGMGGISARQGWAMLSRSDLSGENNSSSAWGAPNNDEYLTW